DPPDGVHRSHTTALQILLTDSPLHPLPHAQRRLTDREQDLAHAPEHGVLRVPEGQEARAECDRPALLVNTIATGQGIHEELDVGELGPEVVVVGVLGAAAAAGLVVDDLARALTRVVDPVDLSMNLGAVEPERELAFDHQRAEPPDRLQAGRKADVVVKDAPDLLLLRPAMEDRVDAVQVAVQVFDQSPLQPFPLQLLRQRAPLGLAAVEILQHTMQEAPALHLHAPRWSDQARVVVVPVEARALQIVIERSRAEVARSDPFRPRPVRLELAARLRVPHEAP